MPVWFNLPAYTSGYRFRRQYKQALLLATVFTCERTLFIWAYSPAQKTSKKVREMSSVGALIEPREGSYQRWHHPFTHNYLSVSSRSPLN